jgi:DNA-binding NtrC family response regulator
VVLATSEEVPASVLPEQVLQSTGVRTTAPGPDGKLPAGASLFEIVADFERRIIIEALEQCGYSQTEAATELRIPLSTLNQKIKRLDIPIKRRSA